MRLSLFLSASYGRSLESTTRKWCLIGPSPPRRAVYWNWRAKHVSRSKKGKTTNQAHVGLPAGTFEEEHGRKGFYGKSAHLYRTRIRPRDGFGSKRTS